MPASELQDRAEDSASTQNTSLATGKGPTSQRQEKDVEYTHPSHAEESEKQTPLTL